MYLPIITMIVNILFILNMIACSAIMMFYAFQYVGDDWMVWIWGMFAVLLVSIVVSGVFNIYIYKEKEHWNIIGWLVFVIFINSPCWLLGWALIGSHFGSQGDFFILNYFLAVAVIVLIIIQKVFKKTPE